MVCLCCTETAGPVAPQCPSQVRLRCQVPEARSYRNAPVRSGCAAELPALRSYCNAQVWFACAAQRPLVLSHRTGTRRQKRCSGSSALKQRFSHGPRIHTALHGSSHHGTALHTQIALHTKWRAALYSPAQADRTGHERCTALPLIASKHRSEAGAGAQRAALQPCTVGQCPHNLLLSLYWLAKLGGAAVSGRDRQVPRCL